MIAAVAHREYADMGLAKIALKVVAGGVIADVKSTYEPADITALGLRGWRL